MSQVLLKVVRPRSSHASSSVGSRAGNNTDSPAWGDPSSTSTNAGRFGGARQQPGEMGKGGGRGPGGWTVQRSGAVVQRPRPGWVQGASTVGRGGRGTVQRGRLRRQIGARGTRSDGRLGLGCGRVGASRGSRSDRADGSETQHAAGRNRQGTIPVWSF